MLVNNSVFPSVIDSTQFPPSVILEYIADFQSLKGGSNETEGLARWAGFEKTDSINSYIAVIGINYRTNEWNAAGGFSRINFQDFIVPPQDNKSRYGETP